MGTICGVLPTTDPGCGVLLDPLDGRVFGGCARVKITYGPGEEESAESAPVLAQLAGELRRIPHLTDLEIVVAAGKGEDVRVLDRRFHRIVAVLGALGVAPGRLSRAYQPADNEAGFVIFEPYACDQREIMRRREPGQAR
jgi:hypothetical protein